MAHRELVPCRENALNGRCAALDPAVTSASRQAANAAASPPPCVHCEPQAVKASARDVLFRRAQDVVSSQLYFNPSQRLARSLGLR